VSQTETEAANCIGTTDNGPTSPEALQQFKTSHWDEQVARVESKEHKGWLDWEFIEVEYIRPQVSGNPGKHYLQYFLDQHIKALPVERALSLGCGGGNLERVLIQSNAAKTIDGFDASPESIKLAKKLAQDEGIEQRICYEVRDINNIRLDTNSYDFVIAKMSLHHFENLEHIYQEVNHSLKNGGVFMFNEFIGPSRFQWTKLQLKLINELLKILPEKNRWSSWANAPLVELPPHTISDMIDMDPTEAVRSDEIVSVLSHFFEIIERKDYGGTLLHELLTHTMASFDLEDKNQKTLLNMMFLYEQTLIHYGVLKSDFTYVVAKPLRLRRKFLGV